MTSPERMTHTNEMTLEEARQDLEHQLALLQVTDDPDTDGGRRYRDAISEILGDDEMLGVYVDTQNDILRKQREIDATL